MRLVLDTNIILAELFRERWRRLLEQPAFEMAMTVEAWAEVRYELPRRIARRQQREGWPEAEATRWVEEIERLLMLYVTPIPAEVYNTCGDEARERIPRDPDDWP